MRKPKLTKEEEATIRAHINPTCPGKVRLKSGMILRCGSRSTAEVGGRGHEHYYFCHVCNHEWGWTSPTGRRLTHGEYDAMLERRRQEFLSDSGKTHWSYGKDMEEGEGTMAKGKKAAKKTSKKKGSKGSKTVGAKKGSGMCAAIRGYVAKHPKADVTEIVAAVKKLTGVVPAEATVRTQMYRQRKSMGLTSGVKKVTKKAKKKAKKSKRVSA